MRNYFGGDHLHSAMNYPLYNGLIDFAVRKISSYDLKEIIMSIYENYPKQAIYSAMNLIGSHDRPRVLTRLNTGVTEEAEEERHINIGIYDLNRLNAIKRFEMLTALQMALPGMPSIYYGDEAGMEGGSDPYNRGTYPWGKENTSILDWYHKITKARNTQLIEMMENLPEIKCIDENLLSLTYRNNKKEINIIVNNDEKISKRCVIINPFKENSVISEILYDKKIEKNEENDYIIEISPETTLFSVTLSQ
jgi:4-alpha-glucanotransferase